MRLVTASVRHAQKIGWANITLVLLAMWQPQWLGILTVLAAASTFLIAILLLVVTSIRELGISTATTTLHRNRDLLAYSASWKGFNPRLIMVALFAWIELAMFAFLNISQDRFGASSMLLAFSNAAFLVSVLRYSRKWPTLQHTSNHETE